MHLKSVLLLILFFSVFAFSIFIACSSSGGGDDDNDNDDSVAADDDTSGGDCTTDLACNKAVNAGCGDALGWSGVDGCLAVFESELATCADGSGYLDCVCSDCFSLTDCDVVYSCVTACYYSNCE